MIFLLAGCGDSNDDGSDGETSSSRTYIGTQSPGDVWTWTINDDGTFSATNETATYTYSGSFTTLPNGFLKLTVISTTDPGLTPPEIAYALEVPDTALLVKPAGTDSKIIVAAAQGDCPTADASYNWIEMPHDSWDSTVDTAYGVTSSTVTGSDFAFSHNFYYLSGVLKDTDTETGFTCSDGRITKAGEDIVIGITPSEVLVGDSGPGNGGFVGMEAPAVDVPFSDFVPAGMEFRGVLFRNNSADEDTQPVWARTDGSGDIIGGDYDDFEAGTENQAVTLTLDAQASPGVVNGTLTDPGGSNNFTLITDFHVPKRPLKLSG